MLLVLTQVDKDCWPEDNSEAIKRPFNRQVRMIIIVCNDVMFRYFLQVKICYISAILWMCTCQPHAGKEKLEPLRDALGVQSGLMWLWLLTQHTEYCNRWITNSGWSHDLLYYVFTGTVPHCVCVCVNDANLVAPTVSYFRLNTLE